MTIVNGGLINVGKGGQAGGTGGGGTPLALSDGLACFAGSFSGITTASFSHGLNTTDLIVEFKDNSNNLLIPDNWLVINPNTIEVEFATPQIGNLVIIGCVASGQIPNVGGVTLLEGLSGIIDLDSSDGSINISTSGQVINLTATSASVSTGAIFITHVEAINGGDTVTVTEQAAPNDGASDPIDVTSPPLNLRGSVLEIASDTSQMRVFVEWDRTVNEYQGSPLVNGSAVTVSERVGDTYRASVELPSGAIPPTIDAVLAGVTYSIPVTAIAGPVIQTAVFDLVFPIVPWGGPSQTEVKDNDLMTVDITTDISTDRVEFENSDGLANTFVNVGPSTSFSADSTVNTSFLIPTACTGRVKARSAATGAWGDFFNITNTMTCNNIRPSVSIGATTFPIGQTAFKGVEVGSQANTITDFSEILYTSPHGDFTIANTTTSETAKAITCTNPGDYNDSANNFQIRARRVANGSETTDNIVIEVADTAPAIIVTQPQARLRSGGNDGTVAQDYLITATADQNLSGAPDLGIPVGGTFQGGGFVGGPQIWTRTISIHDNDGKGTGAWTLASPATNNAGISATIAGTQNNGGFISRALSLAAFANTTTMNVDAITYTKVTINWSFKALPNRRAVGTTAPPADANSWALNTLSPFPNTINILDLAATLASSSPSIVTMEEII